MEHLLNAFDGLPLDAITSANFITLEQKRRADCVSGSSIRRDLACLSVIFSCAEEWEWVKHNPVKPFLRGRAKKGLTEGEPRTRYLSPAEESAILEYAPPKARIAIIVAIDTGLRKEEQFSLLWSDIDLAKRELRVRAEVAKSSKTRVVPLLERTHRLLTEMRQAPVSPFVFTTSEGKRYSTGSPTNYEALQKACRRTKITEHVEWHDLRRTCGCRLLQSHQLTMTEVSKWLGHSSVVVTERHYAFISKEALHDAVRRSEQRARASG